MTSTIDIRFCGKSDIGRMRSNNEDTNIAETIGAEERYVLAAAIDGVGGYEGGEVAADIVRETLLEHLRASADSMAADPAPVLKAALETANNKVLAYQQADPRLGEMGAVCTAALFDKEEAQVCIAHVGDTRAYVFKDGQMTKLTHDHSPVGLLEDSGLITESEAMNHPRRNVVSRLIGMTHGADEPFIDSFVVSYSLPAVFLICSDGLTDLVDAQFIQSMLSDGTTTPEQKSDALIAEANRIKGKDNITAVVVECTQEKPANDLPHVAQEAQDISTSEINIHQGGTETPAPPRPFVSRTVFALSMTVCLLAGFIAGYLTSDIRQSNIVLEPLTPIADSISPGTGHDDAVGAKIDTIRTVRDSTVTENEER